MIHGPKYITKYFKAEDLEYFKSGQIFLGTILEYAKPIQSFSEATASSARMKDRLEGTSRTEIHGSASTSENISVKLPGINISGANFSGNKKLITLDLKLNEYAFCTSVGRYSKSHHKIMLNGIEGQYSGNSELTNYVVFDNRELRDAIVKVPNDSLQRDHFGKTPMALGGYVAYEGRDSNFIVDSGSIFDAKETVWANTVLCKPSDFWPEKEYRIIFRPDKTLGQSDSDDGILLKSKEIRSSMKSFGKI